MFLNIISDLSYSLNSLREFVTYVKPLLEQRAHDTSVDHSQAASEDAKRLLILLAEPGSKVRERLERSSFRIEFHPPDAPPPEVQDAAPQSDDSSMRKPEALSEQERSEFAYLMQRLSADAGAFRLPKAHLGHLYETSLISLVSISEWFLARVLHTLFDKVPGTVESDKTFTVGELKALGSIDRVVQDAVESKVESIMQKTVEEQFAYLGKTFGAIDLSFSKITFPEIVEAHARRNAFVHTGGRVTQRYLDRTTKAGILGDRPKLNTHLAVYEPYLERAINIFESVYVQLAMLLWKQVQPDDEERSSMLFKTVEQIEAGRYKTARAWSRATLQDAKMSKAVRLQARVNVWQTYKWEGRFDEVRREVEEEDLTMASPMFKLARLALLDDADGFYNILPAAIAEGTLRVSYLETWPIFRGIRSERRFKAELEKIKNRDGDSGKNGDVKP